MCLIMCFFKIVKVERHEGNVVALSALAFTQNYFHSDASHHWRCHPRDHHNYRRFHREGDTPSLVSVCLNFLLF
jgi:hypothetical protein